MLDPTTTLEIVGIAVVGVLGALVYLRRAVHPPRLIVVGRWTRFTWFVKAAIFAYFATFAIALLAGVRDLLGVGIFLLRPVVLAFMAVVLSADTSVKEVIVRIVGDRDDRA